MSAKASINMPKATIIFSVFLIVIGVGFYTWTGSVAITALLPAFLGIPILALGALAFGEKRRKHVMHGAFGLGVLGLVAGLMGVVELPKLLAGAEIERPLAVTQQLVVLLASAIYVGLGFKSFRDARRQRTL